MIQKINLNCLQNLNAMTKTMTNKFRLKCAKQMKWHQNMQVENVKLKFYFRPMSTK